MEQNRNNRLNYNMLKKDLIVVNAIVGVVVLAVFIMMVLQRLGIVPHLPCIVHELLRVYCPGCGGTRAIFALLEGEFIESLYYNPAVLLGGFLVLYYEAGVLLTLVKKNGKRYYSNHLLIPMIYLAIVLVFSVVRNYLLIECGLDMLQDFIL